MHNHSIVNLEATGNELCPTTRFDLEHVVMPYLKYHLDGELFFKMQSLSYYTPIAAELHTS